MPEQVGFEFPIDLSDQWDGFNDAGMEHFMGSPYAALGREVPQNVIDATDQQPARIVVRLLNVDTASIPNVEQLRAALNSCKAGAADESEKAKIFFKQATEAIEQPKIVVLQIADYNTTGVTGPCTNGSPYYALMKAPGQSKKAGDNNIGTFGIGKYAPFVVSGIRTVFLSTVWTDGNDWHHYVQGKSILMSHYNAEGRTHRGVGYWGIKDRCQPVIGLSAALPQWLKRADNDAALPDARGATLSILGFDPVKGWQQKLGATIAENFFGAIAKGKLEVDIDGVVILNKLTIRDILEDEDIKASLVDMKDEPARFENALLYLEAVSGGEGVIVEQTENFHLGNCELRLIVREKLPKRVAFLRDGMLITQDLEGLRRFGDFKEFVGVLECHAQKGNRLLKNMEPPKHDDFEPERLPTPRERRAGRVGLRELAVWVREMLKRHAQDPVSAVSSVDELKEFFWDDADEGSEERESEVNPLGRAIIRARPLPKKDRPVTYEVTTAADDDSDWEGDEGEGSSEGGGETGGGGDGDGGGGGTGGAHTGGGDGSHGGSSGGGTKNTPARVRLENVRSIPVTRRTRTIAFTPDYSGDIRVVVQDSGADSNHALQVVSASAGAVTQGRIDGLKVTKGSRYTLQIELGADFDGAMRVAADAV